MNLFNYWIGFVLQDNSIIFPRQENTAVGTQLDYSFIGSIPEIALLLAKSKSMIILKGRFHSHNLSATENILIGDAFKGYNTIENIIFTNINGESFTITREEWKDKN